MTERGVGRYPLDGFNSTLSSLFLFFLLIWWNGVFEGLSFFYDISDLAN